MSESYVRPPLVSREAPSPAWAIWRFRVVALLVAAGLIVLLVLGYQALSGANSEDPGLKTGATSGLRIGPAPTAP